jgi:hypothetical protein
LLRRLGTDRMTHRNGRSLFDHLVGLGHIVDAWGSPRRVRDAARFHSAYGTSAYREAAVGRNRRELVRATIGVDAERLAYAFGAIDRPRFSAAIARMGDAPMPCALPTRFGERATYDRRDVVDLTLLGIANEIEQTCADDGSPAPWRLFCSALLGALTRWRGVALPDTVRRGFAATPEAEADAVAAYASAIASLRAGDTFAAEAGFHAVAESQIGVAEPLVWLANVAVRAGNRDAAERAAAEARVRFLAWGSAWDKRISLENWTAVAGILARERTSVDLIRRIDAGS